MSDLVENLQYVACILEANADKFTVPDHIPAKVRRVREAADRISLLMDALREADDALDYLVNAGLKLSTEGRRLADAAHTKARTVLGAWGIKE